jgi:hypothetical protein
MLGEIRGIEGREMLIAVDADINPEYLELLAHGQKNYVALELLDNRRISPKQNKVAHALIGDIANWQGDFPIVTEQFLKYYLWLNPGSGFLMPLQQDRKQEIGRFFDRVCSFK